MGHLINPTRFRIGSSIFWQNNWPTIEETRYMYYHGLYQELDQYFRTLFHTLYTPVYIDNEYVKEPFFGNFRFPHIIYSNLNINLLGFHSNTLILDINFFDLFLDEFLNEFFSPLNKDAHLNHFIYKLKKFYNLDYYLKYLRVLKYLTKRKFLAIITNRRRHLNLIQKVLIEKIKKFFNIYFEYIKRSLFSYINDTKNLIDKTLLFENELFDICDLPFKVRKDLLLEYWDQKYSNIEENSLLTFSQYFTSVFYNEITSHKEQKLDQIQFLRARKFFTKFQEIKNYDEEQDNKILDLIKDEIYLQHIQQKNYIIDRQNLLYNLFNSKFVYKYLKRSQRIEEIEFPSEGHRSIYDKFLGKEFKKNLKKEINKSFLKIQQIYNDNNFYNFNLDQNNLYLKFYKKVFNSFYMISNIIKIRNKEIYNLTNKELNIYFKYLIQEFDINYINSQEFQEIKNKIQKLIFINNKNSNILLEKKNLIHFIQKKINNFTIKKIKKKSINLISSNLDPFYQKFLALKNINNLILNVNIGLNNKNFHITANFLTLYIKRLFFQENPIWYIQRALRRILNKLTYLTGYLIIFAGRFTRTLYATYKIQNKGYISYGHISKLIDYDTIGFVSKFGFCGIKVFLQYKNNWNILKDKHKQFFYNYENHAIKTSPLPLININNSKVHIIPKIFNNSRNLKRIVNSYITNPKIPYYNDKN